MGNNLVSIHAEDIRAVGNRVIVSEMHFGEQKTRGGIIIRDDDGTSRGIYPRWGKVFRKGPKNSEPYEEGQWVLVEHGRWTRGLSITIGDVERTLRMVEAERDRGLIIQTEMLFQFLGILQVIEQILK